MLANTAKYPNVPTRNEKVKSSILLGGSDAFGYSGYAQRIAAVLFPVGSGSGTLDEVSTDANSPSCVGRHRDAAVTARLPPPTPCAPDPFD